MGPLSLLRTIVASGPSWLLLMGIQQERQLAGQRLKRLGKAYVDGLYPDDDYRREKMALEEKLTHLVVPGVDAARDAGQLLEGLPTLGERPILRSAGSCFLQC